MAGVDGHDQRAHARGGDRRPRSDHPGRCRDNRRGRRDCRCRRVHGRGRDGCRRCGRRSLRDRAPFQDRLRRNGGSRLLRRGGGGWLLRCAGDPGGQQRSGSCGLFAIDRGRRARGGHRRCCHGRDRNLRCHGGRRRAIARPLDQQAGTTGRRLHAQRQCRHRRSELENDAQSARHRLAGPDRTDHAGRGRKRQAARGAGFGQVQHQPVRPGEGQGLVGARTLQLHFRPGPGGPLPEHDRVDLAGPGAAGKRQRGEHEAHLGSVKPGNLWRMGWIQSPRLGECKTFSLNNPWYRIPF